MAGTLFALSLVAVSLAFLSLSAMQMPHDTILLRTDDGTCPTHVFEPEGSGPWPGVIMYMDAYGIRPALIEIASRLASAGYHVVLPDLYYRSGYAAPGSSLFKDPAVGADWTTRIVPTLSNGNIMRDVPALLSHLDASLNVLAGPIGVVGYCMGGRMSLSAAGSFPERVAAAASYHGGDLVTKEPDSPHLLASMMRARIYVGGAKEDAGFDDGQKQRLEDALTAAHVTHTIETYDARHGWVPSDTPAHDAAATEKHWVTLLRLFNETLKRPG